MHETATRARCVEAPSRELWRSIPLDLIVSVAAVLLAGILSATGLLP